MNTSRETLLQELADLRSRLSARELEIEELKSQTLADRQPADIYATLHSGDQFFQAFRNSMAAMSLVRLSDGVFLEVNKAWTEIFGYSRDRVVGRTSIHLGIWENDANCESMRRTLQETGAVKKLELQLKTKAGERRTLIASCEVLSIAGEQVVLANALDITDRQRAEEALYLSEQKFAKAFRSNPAAIALITIPDGVVLDVNATLLTIFGFQREEVIGKTTRELGIWPSLHSRQVMVDEFRGKGSIRGREEMFCKKSGRQFPVTLSLDPITLGDQEVAVVTFEDITERKKSEEALRRLNESLEEQVAERTSLAEARARQLQTLAVELIEAEERERRRIAHLLHEDLQQMLAAARMQLDAVSQHQSGAPTLASVRELLSESIAKSRRLSHDLSPPGLQHSNVKGSLEWIVRFFLNQFGFKVELHADDEQPFEDGTLRVFVFRAVQELLFNVVKHAGVKSARVALSCANSYHTVSVEDGGCGIDPDLLDSSKKRVGLGLLSLRERARYFGGDLMIESAPGEGSRFTLTLPIGAFADRPDRPVIAGRHKQPVKETAVSGAEMIRVLFVDDHEVMRQGLINLVGHQPGIHVAGEACNGREAIEQVRRSKPDVAVMDISMPEMDGIEATRRIKAQWPQVRVVALSMYEDEHITRAMHEAGADAFVSKTASSAKLLQAIFGTSNGQ